MTRFSQALREAGLLFVIAAALGFIYTAATEKGMFARGTKAAHGSRADMAAPAMISRTEAQALFDSSKALFIDARHDFDYKLGHIKGAINVPLKDFDTAKSALSSVPKNRLIVSYCDGAECNSSIELSVKLMKEGYTNVRIFFGGWREWRDAGLPVESTP